jgi:hypothetical protein
MCHITIDRQLGASASRESARTVLRGLQGRCPGKPFHSNSTWNHERRRVSQMISFACTCALVSSELQFRPQNSTWNYERSRVSQISIRNDSVPADDRYSTTEDLKSSSIKHCLTEWALLSGTSWHPSYDAACCTDGWHSRSKYRTGAYYIFRYTDYSKMKNSKGIPADVHGKSKQYSY